jgi:signal transduction histidine kinase
VATDLIEIAAEDLTRHRVLQERLDKAHRMEAVGRLASEVAATCGNLLNDIHQNAQEWLTAAGADNASRQRGEALVEDVSRAVGLLRQLAACGEEQARAPKLVDLNTLVRDLEPVLKRVAGGDVDVRLKETSSPLNVDVGMERVERLFVNLASYGRERMPFGGRLTIELGTVVVDRHFAVKHPDVRLGLHALITVTETRRAARADGPPRQQAAARHSQGSVEPRAGVDFRTLQQLVGECGGHLWVKVQPPGDMVVKIRLPLLSGSHDETAPNARGAGVRAIVRRFTR